MSIIYFELAKVMHKLLFVSETLLDQSSGYIGLEDQSYVVDVIETARESLMKVEEQPPRWRTVFGNMMKAANLMFKDQMAKKVTSREKERPAAGHLV